MGSRTSYCSSSARYIPCSEIRLTVRVSVRPALSMFGDAIDPVQKYVFFAGFPIPGPGVAVLRGKSYLYGIRELVFRRHEKRRTGWISEPVLN